MLLMVGGGWWLYSVRAAARKVRKTAWYLEALQDQFPEAFEVLSRFDENCGLEKLAEASPDLEKAFEVIKSHARQEQQPRKPGEGLNIAAKSRAEEGVRKLKAALVTIVRGIYASAEDVECLGEGGQAALDAFLGSITD